MTRLLVHVEGQTEETFVNEVLAPHFHSKGYTGVSARLIGNARLRTRRGGIKGWSSVRSDIHRHLLSDQGCVATTMVDYYALPTTGPKAWPGRLEAAAMHHDKKALHIQELLIQDLKTIEANNGTAHSRFIPFIAMHEFEALLFSDCSTFASSLCRPGLSEQLQIIRDQFASPEHINDSPQTAPSKRVEQLFPGYEKPLFGNIAALEIGLSKIKSECPHFASWIDRLEGIVQN